LISLRHSQGFEDHAAARWPGQAENPSTRTTVLQMAEYRELLSGTTVLGNRNGSGNAGVRTP